MVRFHVDLFNITKRDYPVDDSSFSIIELDYYCVKQQQQWLTYF